VSDELRLSVALVTRNRPDALRRCLESLRAQSMQPFEIVVSDDSDAGFLPQTQEVARQFGCRWIAGPQRGLYANRNAAALACAGTHIRTMDDDHTFPPGHFSRCAEAVRNDPRAIWTTGEAGFVDGKSCTQTNAALQLHPSGVGIPPTDPDDNWAIADGSTIYPRAIFDSGLRMVEFFSYGSSYLEFGAFLYSRGFRSRCVSGAMVEHLVDSTEVPRLTDWKSILFASICYNLHFRPNARRAVTHIAACLFHSPSVVLVLPSLLREASQRWRLQGKIRS
jgi:glycosyltransferase involved in cell wall biosynthesis